MFDMHMRNIEINACLVVSGRHMGKNTKYGYQTEIKGNNDAQFMTTYVVYLKDLNKAKHI